MILRIQLRLNSHIFVQKKKRQPSLRKQKNTKMAEPDQTKSSATKPSSFSNK